MNSPLEPTPDAPIAVLQQALAARGLSLREPPAAPTTCCGGGCNGCVWESYYAALDYWREQALELLNAD